MTSPKLITDAKLDLFVQDRSPGKHVSSAIHRVMKNLYPDRFDSGPIDPIRANLGNALENAMVDAMVEADPDRYVIPGAQEHNGIFGTPDLLDTKDWGPVELKLTWASSRRAEDIEDPWFWRYWVQLKAYCKMLDATKGKLIIVFINGDYKGGAPQGFEWEWEWAQEEIDETWGMIEAYSEVEK
jgi:hypothetical protein